MAGTDSLVIKIRLSTKADERRTIGITHSTAILVQGNNTPEVRLDGLN